MQIMNDPVLEGLREIFKQEWDNQYGTTKGVWDDTCISGQELYNMEKTKHAAKDYLHLFKAGRRSDWDVSALSYAILYSNALKTHVPLHVSNNVNILRDLRNKLMHTFASKHRMPDAAFKNAYQKIKNCLIALLLSTAGVERVRNSRKRRPLSYFWYLAGICLTIFMVGSVLSYYWPQESGGNKLTFRVLPPRPSHLIVNRSRTVNAILGELHNLSIRNRRALTYMYISGPPGSGKLQIARFVGQQYSTNIGSTFVMTINGISLLHVLNSYIDFANRMNCKKTVTDRILGSDQMKTGIKVKNLQSEIVTELKRFNNKYTWLMIVANILKLDEILPFLPQPEDHSWEGGQVLITTQDISSVPSNSSLSVHISVSPGMDPMESSKVLTDLSGLAENQDLVSEVAKKLDHQPLALATAALYVRQLRKSKAQFTWKDYLKQLDEEKRNQTKIKQIGSNDISSSMHAAVSLAVRWTGENDSVLKHAFTFLSFVSHEWLALKPLHAFIVHVDRDAYKIIQKIQQCFLIFSLDEDEISFVSLHPIVHDIIKLYVSHYVKEDKNHPRIVLQMLVIPRLPILGQYYIPHLKSFYHRANSVPLEMLIPKLRDLRPGMYNRLFYFAIVLEIHDEFSLFKYYKDLAFRVLAAAD